MSIEAKQKLIQPLFSLLGWDFTKDQDVSYERSGGRHTRVDYQFGNHHFYLEAKAPSQDLQDDLLQANSYAYNKGRFCVLTDFQRFTLIKPIKPNKDKPQLSVVESFDLNYKQYLEQFDLIWDTFSKKAVLLDGSLDALLEKERKKRKFYTVDEDFLRELEGWREDLAEDIWLNNKKAIGLDENLLAEYAPSLTVAPKSGDGHWPRNEAAGAGG